jgi:hypothetical protein
MRARASGFIDAGGAIAVLTSAWRGCASNRNRLLSE